MDNLNDNSTPPVAAEEQSATGPSGLELIKQRAQRIGLVSPDEPTSEEPLSDLQKLGLQNAIKAKLITPENYRSEIEKNYGGSSRFLSEAQKALGIQDEQAAVNELEAAPEVAQALKGTGLEQPGANTVLRSPVQQSIDEAFQLQDAERALASNQIQNQAKLEEERQVAQAKAQQDAQVRSAAEQVRAQEQAVKRVEQNDEVAKQDIPEEKPGLSVGQAFAILLGGVSQGLTGAKENPAMQVLEKASENRMKQIEQEAQKNKWTEEHKLAVQKAELDRQLALSQMESRKIDNQKTRAEIAKIQSEVAQTRDAIATRQQLIAMEKGGKGVTPGLTAEQLKTLVPQKEQGQYIRNPATGTFFRAIGSESELAKIREQMDQAVGAIQGLGQLKELNKKYGNNWIAKSLAFSDSAEAQAIQRGVIGGIRLEYFGPGVLSDKEQALAADIVKDPTKIASLAKSNERSLNAIIKKLNMGIKQRMVSQGIEVPPSPAEAKNIENMGKLMRANPKLDRAQAATILIDTNQWFDEY